VKHNNSHLEKKRGASSVRHVFKSALKDGILKILRFVKSLEAIASSNGFIKVRIVSMEK